jgi:hypothetical protein
MVGEIVSQIQEEFEKNRPPLTEEDRIRARIEKRYNERKEVQIHAAVYVGINVALWIFWFMARGAITGLIGDPRIGELLTAVPLPLMVSLGWGAGLVGHYVNYYFQSGPVADQREEQIQEEIERTQPSPAGAKKIRARIERRSNEKKEVAIHASVYVIINLLLWILWGGANGAIGAIIGDSDITRILAAPLPLLVTLGWGVGLVAHFIAYSAKNAGAEQREREVQEAIARERQRTLGETSVVEDVYDEKPKRGRDRRLHLDEDGELTDSYAQEWDEQRDRKRKRR